MPGEQNPALGVMVPGSNSPASADGMAVVLPGAYAARCRRFENPGTGGSNGLSMPYLYRSWAVRPAPFVCATRYPIEKPVPKVQSGLAAKGTVRRGPKRLTDRRRSGLKDRGFFGIRADLQIGVSRLMRLRA